jgi:hypothetical protein
VIGFDASFNLVCSGDGGDGGDGETPATDYFVFTSLSLRDPHLFWAFFPTNCTDITNVAGGFNPSVHDALTMDQDGDGLLDLSVLLRLDPNDQAVSSGLFDLAQGSCTPGLDCTVGAPILTTTFANNTAAGTQCLTAPPWVVPTIHASAIDFASAPCFDTPLQSGTLNLGLLSIPFEDLAIAAEYFGDPATGLVQGTITGFLSNDVANTVMIETGAIGGPLASLLGGGGGSCMTTDVRQTREDPASATTTMGWWFFFNFDAVAISASTP